MFGFIRRNGASKAIWIGLLIGLLLAVGAETALSYRVIESMQQTVNGKPVTVNGRPTWPQNVTIHVYIPNDPEGSGAEKEVQAACQAWEEKMKSETNANLTFEYHVGQHAPPLTSNTPPPYVIEVNWTEEETTDEPGTATPISDVKPTSDPNVFERSGPVYRGQININRNRGPNNPYNGNSIYNIALHEFGHIFGSDPDKKHPIKDDDVRGLQDGYGRIAGSKVPPKPKADDPSSMKCCTFECGGAFGCAMVNSEFECENIYNGVIHAGACVTTSQDEQDGGVFGQCVEPPESSGCEDCRSSSGKSYYAASPPTVPPGGAVTFTAALANDGTALSRFDVTMSIPKGTELSLMQSSVGSFPSQVNGSIHWLGCIPPGKEAILSYRVRVPEDAVMGAIISSTMILRDVFTRDTLAYVASATVGGDAASMSYRWTFTVTPSAILTVAIPMPEEIRTALVTTEVVALRLIEGELPPVLQLGDYPWTVSGIVFNTGFLLPWMSTIQSTALYEGLTAEGRVLAHLVIDGTIARPDEPTPIPFGSSEEPDSDGDTVPDFEDDCPNVPGDPAFGGCPGYEEYEDADGDGISDLDDLCPDLPGSMENGGCPE